MFVSVVYVDTDQLGVDLLKAFGERVGVAVLAAPSLELAVPALCNPSIRTLVVNLDTTDTSTAGLAELLSTQRCASISHVVTVGYEPSNLCSAGGSGHIRHTHLRTPLNLEEVEAVLGKELGVAAP